MASLPSTGAAAVAAGIFFGAQSQVLHGFARAMGVISVALLLLSTALYGSASLHARDKDLPDIGAYEKEIRHITKTIMRRTRDASLAGILAALALVVTFGSAVFLTPPTHAVRVHLSDAGHEEIQTLCPHLPQTFDGTVTSESIAGADPFFAVEVRNGDCDHALLSVPRASIAAFMVFE